MNISIKHSKYLFNCCECLFKILEDLKIQKSNEKNLEILGTFFEMNSKVNFKKLNCYFIISPNKNENNFSLKELALLIIREIVNLLLEINE